MYANTLKHLKHTKNNQEIKGIGDDDDDKKALEKEVSLVRASRESMNVPEIPKNGFFDDPLTVK